jgi:hypothetical protein
VLAWTSVAIAALLIRLFLLPVWPIPQPRIHDEFSYLLSADTFSSGRVTNPSHPLWHFFETFHVLSVPTYASKYPPAQGLVLAFGQIVFGHPWFGVWLSAGAMAGALCWMLQGWLPSGWALLAGSIAMLRLAALGDWTNSYWGGAVAAIGGALVLGAYPRIVFRSRMRYSWAFWFGAVILVNSRPFEGMLLILPCSVALLGWAFRGNAFACRNRAFHLLGSGVILICAAGIAMGYQNWRVTGSPLRLPYLEYERQYSASPLLMFESERQSPVYRNEQMRRYYEEISADFSFGRSLEGGLRKLTDFGRTLRFLFGPLLIFFVFATRALGRRRLRLVLICIVLGAAGLAVEPWHRPEHAAPFVGALFLVWAQCARQLRLWSWRGRDVGRGLVASTVALGLLLLVILRANHWKSPGERVLHPLDRRAAIEAELLHAGGSHLIFVRYAPTHSVHEEWAYNRAQIDEAQIVWARDLGALENRKLISYFSRRVAWILEPDVKPVRLRPYVAPVAGASPIR